MVGALVGVKQNFGGKSHSVITTNKLMSAVCVDGVHGDGTSITNLWASKFKVFLP